MERWGWVRRVRRRLAPLDPAVSRRGAAALISEKLSGGGAWEERGDHWGKPTRARHPVGRKIVLVVITEEGLKIMEQVLPVCM